MSFVFGPVVKLSVLLKRRLGACNRWGTFFPPLADLVGRGISPVKEHAAGDQHCFPAYIEV